MSTIQSSPYSRLQSWLANAGGGFHPETGFSQDIAGSRIIATEDLEKDIPAVSCPFSKIITKTLAREAVLQVLGNPSDVDNEDWTERQWIGTYLSLHWIIGESESTALGHYEYLATLPGPKQLRTPLHFTQDELELFKGTNLYGATLDRERDWKKEWDECRSFVAKINSQWGESFSWEKYLTAGTYLSSRSFPSSLLNKNPSLIATPSTEPVLIPGVDSLNHARAQPVSWVVTYPTEEEPVSEPKISLILHTSIAKEQELFNNYGPKPNSELILGYGFSLPANPDDTVVLKLGGAIDGKKWEIGRDARGAEGLWKEILSTLMEPGTELENATYEDILDAAEMMQEMVQAKIDRLPPLVALNKEKFRPEVQSMFYHYIEGQAAILQSLFDFCGTREQEAIELARKQGINLVLDPNPEVDEEEDQ
ncbi:SET domain-containing protein [Agrocybe pediades]|nr:SET domain-containing protein [Agrocybe pediades]